jgi:nicotinate phosphoribosyltransferase
VFDGCRHDSGDPYTWGEMLIAHYRKLKILPETKIGCWSDSLNVDKSIAIAEHFNLRIKIAFGIGQFLCASPL